MMDGRTALSQADLDLCPNIRVEFFAVNSVSSLLFFILLVHIDRPDSLVQPIQHLSQLLVLFFAWLK